MEKTENHITRRLLAFMLTFCLLLQVCPPQAVFAAEETAPITEAVRPVEIVGTDPETPEAEAQTESAEEQTVPEEVEKIIPAESVPAESVPEEADFAETTPSETEEAVPADLAALEAVVAEARALNPDDYAGGWEAMQAALTEAEELLLQEGLTQAQADAAYTKLRASIDTMQPAVQLLSGNVVVTTAEELVGGIASGAYVELGNDITFTADQQIPTIDGTLDGMGYTITLSGKPLAGEVTGTVQNLIVASSGAVNQGGMDPFGVIANRLNNGSIINCGTAANITAGMAEPGGLVGESLGGIIRNCYYAGNLDGFGGGGVIGKSIDTASPSTVTDSYYTKGNRPVSWGNAYNENGTFGNKTAAEMQAPEFVDLLNANITGTGFVWAASNGGYPVLVTGTAPEPPAAADTAALEIVIAEAKGLTAEGYTADSWAKLQTALADAEAALAQQNLTQKLADAAYTALRSAIDTLVPENLEPADPLAELKTLVAEAEALKQEDYTPETWEPFSYNLQDAKACIERSETDPEMIGYAVSDLKQGMANLQKAEKADPLAELKTLVAEAEALKQEDYTAETWGPFAGMLQDAQACIKRNETDAEIIGFTVQDLKDAMGRLQKV